MALDLNKIISIDFEYNNSKNFKMNIVSVAWAINNEPPKSMWLHNDEDAKDDFREICEYWVKDEMIMLCHNAMAEARAFMSLGIDPFGFKWIDNFVEHRMITNHNDKLMFGDQLIKGKIYKTHRKSYDEDSSVETQKPEHSLAATVYKMLGIQIDTDHKDKIRDIIIRGDEKEIEENKEEILKYNKSDVKYLLPVFLEHRYELKRLLKDKYNPEEILQEQFLRAENMIRTAEIERDGYPIDFDKIKNFSIRCRDILDNIAIDINNQFPNSKPFKYNFLENRFSIDTKVVRDFIKEYVKQNKITDWGKTKIGYSITRDMFERFRNGDEFIDGDFGNQIFRYLYTKQHLNGFSVSKGKPSFWNYVGNDKRVRPWLNPYKSQSSRFQPAATGYIPLKAKWMRSLIVPDKNKCIVAIDYKSQEYFLGALIYKDMKMIKAYQSGDVYLAFAKDAKMVPQDATKETHPKERRIAKTCVLGIGYGLTSVGLAKELNCSKEVAQNYIDLYADTYNKYWNGRINDAGGLIKNRLGNWVEIFGKYQRDKYIKLPDGWYMWGDNDNLRSVANMKIQGLGACILRKAIQLFQDKGIKVILPLHDALYIECDKRIVSEISLIFAQCMIDATVYFFKDTDMEEYAKNIKLDFEIWGFEDRRIIDLGEYGKIQSEYLHIEDGSRKQYEYFKKYFEPDNKASLL